MIELPRAVLLADQIAEVADFFSFGTNDLTQTVFGLSRDDAGKFLPAYVEAGILPKDPFVSLDIEGVGAGGTGRRRRPDGVSGGGRPTAGPFRPRSLISLLQAPERGGPVQSHET